ncbi:MAG: hypothetical protein ACYS0G_15070 [Planctomycetota bacterium]|jgi:hypothetical protein
MVIAEETEVTIPRFLALPPCLVRRLGVVAIVAALASAAGYAYSQRNVHRVSLGRGETTQITVEIPMERLGGSSFAKEFNLPVRCTITDPHQVTDGLYVSVIETGHKVQKMWAKLRIIAARDATPGRRRRVLTFTIDGEGGWPQATILINIES